MPYPATSVDLLVHPQCAAGPVAALAVSCVVAADGSLQLEYHLRGELSAMRLMHPPGSLPGERLWQTSCFELFVAVPAACAYREFNFSANGQWAQFRFADYRQPAATASFETGVAVGGGSELRVCCRALRDTFSLSLSLPKSMWTTAGADIYELGFSAVLEAVDGAKSYWALCHPGAAPDFHRREAFAHALSLPRQKSPHSRTLNSP